MEPLHEFNPCQELSPPLQQEGFPSSNSVERLPEKGEHKPRRNGAHKYERRVRNAVKFVRRAALVHADTKEGEISDRTVDVGGRSLAWVVRV